MRAILLSTLTLLTFTACSDTQEKKEHIASKQLQTIQQAKEVVKQTNTSTKAIETAAANITKQSSSGQTLFHTKCSSCHGKKAEKSALNASQIIAGWQKDKIISALSGYKSGTYGGKMKAIMKGQVAPLQEEDINKLATYISGL